MSRHYVLRRLTLERPAIWWGSDREVATEFCSPLLTTLVVSVHTNSPGYLGTSIMMCEAALGLAHDYDRLTPIAKEGGHLTAA